jgi:uncharacterized membrane protein YczE
MSWSGRVRNLVRRALLIVLGWVFVAGAISLLIQLNLGVAPYDVLNTAVGTKLGVSPGTGMWITGSVFVAGAWALGVRPGVGTVAGFFSIGAIVNQLLGVIPEITYGPLRFGVIIPALLVLYVGVCLIIISNFGAGPTEVLMLALHKKGMKLTVARWGIESSCAVLGAVLGGEIGVLTILIVVVAGPCIASLLPKVTKIVGSGTLKN